MRKITFLTGFAAGYVLGARAGVERYEQIMNAVQSFRSNPKVQDTLSTVQEQASTLATQAKEKVAEKRGSDDATTVVETYDVVEVPSTYAQAGSNGTIAP
ncbi:MAG: YtxH domain-containing protein [Actinomycetota bacterium]|nr:YtxH domain-containing protein [Actinomycetota bacterium]